MNQNPQRNLFDTIDPEGRVKLPAKFHEAVKAEGSVMIFCVDKRILVYTVGKWSEIEANLSAMAEKSESIRMFKMDFVRDAFEYDCDESGYIRIPKNLIEQANLTNLIMLAEYTDHIEIGPSE
ncbi:division/cell wall cluster transcriptional repressor MraZ [Thermodesulfobacteriota bacterium]